MKQNLRKVWEQFDTDFSASPYGSGHINETYYIPSPPQLILQKINTSIFKRPDQVMQNIVAVTEHLRKKIIANGGDPMRETLTVIPTKDGKSYYEDENGNAYRMYYFITDAKSFDRAENPEMFAASASAFGRFQRMLADFPAHTLFETIELSQPTQAKSPI